MADIIQLLPDAIANQIAAGEVIQRPASVVKELLENSIDAGSTEIKLLVKDAGKTLVQVIDNGCGMSETDARMSFERHATSKIRAAKDLFAIRTMGFRGEAMASIAAVAQVELRSRRQSDDLGTRIVVEDSMVKVQEACQCAAGTNTSVKNLFYNVPARRNFLKSNTVEMRHIIDEFQRVAIANPDIFFSLHHNNSEVFHLPAGKLRQRLVGIFGAHTNKRLVPVQEETDVLKLFGYIGKPEFAKKARGEQLFFVNQRFIKSGYLNHAVMTAYEDLLPKDSHPFYVIFIEIDPSHIDINVHPTKQEIKFDDERLVYNYLRVAIRHALGQYSITPTLDFSPDHSFSQYKMPFTETRENKATPASNNSSGSSSNDVNFKRDDRRQNSNLDNWQKLYEGLQDLENENPELLEKGEASVTISSKWSEETPLDDASGSFSKPKKEPYQIHATYIVSQIKSGFLLIDQQAAHERILYEKNLASLDQQKVNTQKALFPVNIQLSPADANLLRDIQESVNQMGFDIQDFGQDSFIVHGVPADMGEGQEEQVMIESLLEQYKSNFDLKLEMRDNIARSAARSAAIKRGQRLAVAEMQNLIDRLFACNVPFKSPSGRLCFKTYDLEDLEKVFRGS